MKKVILELIRKELGQPPGKYFIFMDPDTGLLIDSDGWQATRQDVEKKCNGEILVLPKGCQPIGN